MKILQETLEGTLMEILAEEDSVGSLNDLKARVVETIKDDAAAGLKEKWDYQQQFEERLRKHWGKPLELLDLFISLATEAGDEFNQTFREVPASRHCAAIQTSAQASRAREGHTGRTHYSEGVRGTQGRARQARSEIWQAIQGGLWVGRINTRKEKPDHCGHRRFC